MSNTEPFTTLDLLRHGKIFTPGLFCAYPDEPLSKEGLLDLFLATNTGHWDIIISSPYRRCQEFAELLSQQKQCELKLDNHFQEMDFGDWTGVASDILWQQESEQLQRLWQKPDLFSAPGGESMRDFVLRVDLGLQNLLNEQKNRSILLITHAGVIRIILAKALGISCHSSLRFTIEYACLSQLQCYSDGICSLYSHGLRSSE